MVTPGLPLAYGSNRGGARDVAVTVVFDNQDKHRKTLQENEKSQEKINYSS
jgi:hypothetical protein